MLDPRLFESSGQHSPRRWLQLYETGVPENSRESVIICNLVAVESAHSMGVKERYHGVLRSVYSRFAEDQPALYAEFILAASV